MENREKKSFTLILLLGFLILAPQLFSSLTQQRPSLHMEMDDQLLQVSKQRPYLFFQAIPVNLAGPQQLVVIPGIGPELSRRIIAYRTEHGPFRSLNEIGKVKGVGPRKLASLKAYCRL